MKSMKTGYFPSKVVIIEFYQSIMTVFFIWKEVTSQAFKHSEGIIFGNHVAEGLRLA